ncbi:MAG: hypothetical protein MHPSP_004397, partial [Paramarteilia canceri]
ASKLGIINLKNTFIMIGSKNDNMIVCRNLENNELVNYSPTDLIRNQNIDLAFDGNQLSLSCIEKQLDLVSKCKVFARTTPSQKGDIIEILKNNGSTCFMIGDGTNDVLAMRQANSGFSLNTVDNQKIANDKLKKDDNQNKEQLNKKSFFKRLKEKFNSIESNDVVKISNIASSFSSSLSSPML